MVNGGVYLRREKENYLFTQINIDLYSCWSLSDGKGCKERRLYLYIDLRVVTVLSSLDTSKTQYWNLPFTRKRKLVKVGLFCGVLHHQILLLIKSQY